MYIYNLFFLNEEIYNYRVPFMLSLELQYSQSTLLS